MWPATAVLSFHLPVHHSDQVPIIFTSSCSDFNLQGQLEVTTIRHRQAQKSSQGVLATATNAALAGAAGAWAQWLQEERTLSEAWFSFLDFLSLFLHAGKHKLSTWASLLADFLSVSTLHSYPTVSMFSISFHFLFPRRISFSTSSDPLSPHPHSFCLLSSLLHRSFQSRFTFLSEDLGRLLCRGFLSMKTS